MAEMIEFFSREDFRKWLSDNCLSKAGVWLLFGKTGGPKTITAGEALEEALCFGWIDGQMQSIDDKTYKNISLYEEKTANGQKKIKRWLKSWSRGGS